MEIIQKAYNPKEVEEKIYALWLKSGFFSPEKIKKQGIKKLFQKKFVVTIAPPNITGELHMGHALENTLVDIVVRMKRMKGYQTLWVPGIDHASIATQNVIEKQLKKEGLTREQLGKEKFLEVFWKWKEKYGNIILNQLKKLGCSLDWSRTRFTLDNDYKNAVNAAFFHYYKKGWIYQKDRVINWCPRCATSISDLEVKYIPEKTKLYYLKYGDFLVATTRPETKLGDTALAVNPDDERYKEYIGKEIEIETTDPEISRFEKPKIKKIKLPMIADKAVDPNFGTGIVKVTPSHDLSDYEIGLRHNLPQKTVIGFDGKMNSQAGIRFSNLTTKEAREQIVKDLTELGLIEKVEEYEHNLATCDRCDSIIEPLPSKQWFLKMEELAKKAKEAVKKKLIRFHPSRWEKPYFDWLNNIRDWNISRQLWIGHKIPLEGVEDVLDTWFSSALWPFAVFGWPDKNSPDYKNFYPTNLITSDRGILFLWITRMIFSGIELTGKVPFKDVYIHATILTKEGQRMSKSLGTGINPLDLIEKYGTDALRFALAFQTTGIQDIRFNEEVIDAGKKFANKIWNAGRFILLHLEKKSYPLKLPKKLEKIDKEFIKEFKNLAKSTSENIKKFQFAKASSNLYHFFWDKFAAIYLEDSKEKIKNGDKNREDKIKVLLWLFANQLKLLHPFMPFITEEIWGKLPLENKKLLIIEAWPE